MSTIYKSRCVCCSEPTVLPKGSPWQTKALTLFPLPQDQISAKGLPLLNTALSPSACFAVQHPCELHQSCFPVIPHPSRAHRLGRDVRALLLSSALPALSPPVAWEQNGAEGFACKRQHHTCPATTSCQFLNYTWKDISSEH